jgi:hypothetical protein
MFNKYFENRELKAEIVQADIDIDELKSKLKDKIDKNVSLASSLQLSEEKLETSKGLVTKKNKEIEKINKLVRDQTGADLLVNALTELGVIPKEDKRNDSFAEQDRLLRLRNSLAAQQQGSINFASAQGGALSQNALGSLLG